MAKKLDDLDLSQRIWDNASERRKQFAALLRTLDDSQFAEIDAAAMMTLFAFYHSYEPVETNIEKLRLEYAIERIRNLCDYADDQLVLL